MGLAELIFLLSVFNACWIIANEISTPQLISVKSYYKGDWASAIEDATYWAGHKKSICKQVYMPNGTYSVGRTINISASCITFDGRGSTLAFKRLPYGDVCINISGNLGAYKNLNIEIDRNYTIVNYN